MGWKMIVRLLRHTCAVMAERLRSVWSVGRVLLLGHASSKARTKATLPEAGAREKLRCCHHQLGRACELAAAFTVVWLDALSLPPLPLGLGASSDVRPPATSEKRARRDGRPTCCLPWSRASLQATHHGGKAGKDAGEGRAGGGGMSSSCDTAATRRFGDELQTTQQRCVAVLHHQLVSPSQLD